MVFCIYTKFCQSISKGFIVTDLNSRVGARVVENIDGWKIGSLYRAMPEAGTTKIEDYLPYWFGFPSKQQV